VRQTEAHTVALSRVISGIQAIIDGESSKGIARLLRVTDDLAVHASLRWAALVWITWAAKELGAVPLAMETASGARDLAHTMDMRASATTLGLLGEVEALAGEVNQALEYLVQAEELYQSLEDPAGRASVLLLQARLLEEAGRDGYALAKAREALSVAPGWSGPAIFLAQHSLRQGDIGHARELLEDALDREATPRQPEVERELEMIAMVEQGQVPHWVMSRYIELRDAPPSHEVASELERLMLYTPSFLQLRDALAWKLLKLGRTDEALINFEVLSRRDLPKDLRSSVLTGMGMLASISQRHRQAGARTQAAVEAVPDYLRTAQDNRTTDTLDGEQETTANLKRPQTSNTNRNLPPAWEVQQLIAQKAVYSGDLTVFPPVEVLVMLCRSRRTGSLVMSSSAGIGAVFMRQGRLTGAASPDNPNIGGLLKRQGLITDVHLKRASATQAVGTPNKLLGEILLTEGLITPDELQEALIQQVITAIGDLITWDDGTFAFSPEVVGGAPVAKVEVALKLAFVLRELDVEEA
jgi:tetratricopeptide (TPR) repeat protein